MTKGRRHAHPRAKPSLAIPERSPRNQPASGKPSASSTDTSPLTPKTPKTPADEGIEYFQSDIIPGEGPIQVYVLPLEPDGGPSKDRSYIRLPPAYTPFILRVTIEPGTPASKNGVFKTNFPLNGGVFGRDRFAERKLPTDFSRPVQIDLPISHAGAFVYWIEYDGENAGERMKGREGYFNVDPILRTKARSPIISSDLKPLSPEAGGAKLLSDTINLPLGGLSILTVVSKWMGPLSVWKDHFAEARDRGYTMLHYAPLQERGNSDSPYSIKDQLRYDPTLFDGLIKPDGGKAQIEAILKIAKEDFGLLSLTDVVLNHTANDSAWLNEHPEAGYSPRNSPHLTPALELDTAMVEFSSSLESRGLPTRVTSLQDVDTIMKAFGDFLKSFNFWQYYVLGVEREKASVKTALSGEVIPWDGAEVSGKTVVELAQILRTTEKVNGLGKLAGRFSVKVDGGVAAGLVKAAFAGVTENDALAEAWIRVVDVLNVPLYEEWEQDTKIALDHIRNRLTYLRLDKNGPKIDEINRSSPLVESYFTRLNPHPNADPLTYSLANNGWIWDADPLQNFAQLPSRAYLRREVIVWTDCVKLRYGDGPDDNPWLWSHMTKYVISLAQTFDGFRIDNCHSTPLHVGVTLLDTARVVKPDLYVCAELFTGNEDMDTIFVSRLGINSLIRESGNGGDPKELSRLLYRHGVGKPIGSMDQACMTREEELPPPTGRGPIRKCRVTTLNGSIPHALLYDLTHDNESPLDKRTAEDALSTGALVTFSYSAIGSVKGFDDLYPRLLNLVSEKRRYEISGLAPGSGIARVKRIFNFLHLEMLLGGFDEGHVHQENDYIILHRVQPATQSGYLLVARTAFSKGSKDRGCVNPIKLHNTKATFIMGAIIHISSHEIPEDKETIRGLPSQIADISPIVPIQGSDDNGSFTEITIPEHFPPGSIMLFETKLQDHDTSLEDFCTAGLLEAFENLSLVDLNVVLYRAENEERDATNSEFGAYKLPGLGDLVYCGLEGWMHPLRPIMRYNDMGHPLCAHLRDGTWAMDYVHSRLFRQTDKLPALSKPGQWFKERFMRIKRNVPPFLRPKYFALVISGAYNMARRAVLEQCSEFVLSGNSFTQDLAMCAVQLYGATVSASLEPREIIPSLAAGLPHFAVGWGRCWGRDVFISLRGLFLMTGNFEGARNHILVFASTLKHGLIPNLLNSARKPRYNSRDSPWWMLQAIQDYVTYAPNGLSLLSESVRRRFPKDDTWISWNHPQAYAESSTIIEIIQEIMQRHACGIRFREHDAGPTLDGQMNDDGFNVEIKVDWNTGFLHGGNQHNCGTWMDKMGESERAGNKGIPGTSRDGAPVEITGLLKSTLRWLSELSSSGKFPFEGVQVDVGGKKRLITYREWNTLVQESFEKHYYVPLDAADDAKYVINSSLVNRRGIYKDVLGSGGGREWSDYQFRPNFPIAMVVAPEMFDEKHGLDALRLADKVLRSPLGMKSLDPSDMQYRPDYDNSDDSLDRMVAKGLNYHNGPEWGWPLGYYLRAYLLFDTKVGTGKEKPKETLQYLYRTLLEARRYIQENPWAGLPELTNENGQYCRSSCDTQAWSASTLLDFLADAYEVQQRL